VIAVGEPADPPERALVPGADPDREARALVRERPEDEIVEAVEPALEWRGIPGPEMAAEVDRLLEVGAPDLEPLGRPRVRELVAIPAHAEPRDEPPAGERVDGCELLR
jgi:hypothetical protein